MATATAEAPTTDVESLQKPYQMSYEMYERIAELGMIRREEHVVLLDGILVQTMTKGPDHSFSLLCGAEILRVVCPMGWHVRPEQPVALRIGAQGASAPEPDLCLVIGDFLRYQTRHPEPNEVGLVVEVATSPAAFAVDRAGLRRYAYAGISTVWIVSLHDRTIHVFTRPSGPTEQPGYAHVELKRPGGLLEATLSSLASNQPPSILGPIAVGSFFPPNP